MNDTRPPWKRATPLLTVFAGLLILALYIAAVSARTATPEVTARAFEAVMALLMFGLGGQKLDDIARKWTSTKTEPK